MIYILSELLEDRPDLPEPFYCPIKDSECSIKPEISSRPLCFIAIPFRKEMKDTRGTVVKVLKKSGVEPYLADEDVTAGRDILCKICEKITFSDFGVIELTSINPNVMLEFGLVLGRRKPFFILFNKGTESVQKYSIPADIVALDRIEYFDQDALSQKFQKGIKQYIERLDKKNRQIQTMMHLVRETAEDKDFSTSDRLLDLIFDRMEVQKGNDGQFSDLLKEVLMKVDDPDYSMRYSLALARVYAFQKNIKESVSMARDAINKYSLTLTKAFEKAETIVDKEVVQKVAQSKRWSFKDPMFAIYEATAKPLPQFQIFVHLWSVAMKLKEPERVILPIQARIKERFFQRKARAIFPPYRSRLWENAISAFQAYSFLLSFADQYPKKKSDSVKAALEETSSIEATLERYYPTI